MKLGKLALIGAALALAPGIAFAAQEDIGKREYQANCAVCHGTAGKGDGPMAELLIKRMPPLTGLSKANEGVFPFRRVYQVIDGRAEVKAHGPRDMPVWGDDYRAAVFERYGPYYGQLYAEGMIRARILALIAHISKFQEE